MSLRHSFQPLRAVLRKKKVKQFLAIIVIAATIAVFIHYFATHPDYMHRLGQVSPWVIIWVLGLNALMVFVLVLLCEVTVRLCGKHLQWRENFLLTSYSSIANFFGPLQSGPGVRSVYLKTRQGIRLRDYTLASLLGLGLFACFSALFLVVGTKPWWQTLLVFIAVAAASVLVIRLFIRGDKDATTSKFRLEGRVLAALIVLTFIQVCLTSAWYYAELHAVNSHISVRQAMSYAGAANFALFVSVTPDAVGIREAFLVFSQHIHHVSTGDIVSANVIDRAAYAIFLGILFLLVLAMHVKNKLHITDSKRAAPES